MCPHDEVKKHAAVRITKRDQACDGVVESNYASERDNLPILLPWCSWKSEEECQHEEPDECGRYWTRRHDRDLLQAHVLKGGWDRSHITARLEQAVPLNLERMPVGGFLPRERTDGNES